MSTTAPPPLLRPTIPAAEAPSQSQLTTLVAGVVVVGALYLAREVLVPITLAVLLSFVLAPLVNLLRRLWLGRVPSILLAVVLALGIILALGGLIGTQVADLAGSARQYETTIHHKIDTVRGLTIGRLSDVLHGFGHELQNASGTPAPPPAGAAADPHPVEAPPTPVEVRQPDPTPFELLQRVLSPVISPISTMGIIFVVAIFVLMQKEDLRDRLIRLFGATDLHRTTAAMDDAALRLSRYFLTQLAINSMFGVVIGLGLLFIGVPSPLLWGIVGALLRFVPYIGSPIAAVLPIALAAAVSPGWAMMIEAASLYALVELAVSQVVEPLMYGHSTGLSPVAVIISAIFWAWLWGSIGLILSTPLTVCLVVLGRHIERLEFLEVLLGDRPALTPVESFYQRMLAGDPDEAQDHAEHLLRDRSLTAYYDDVALRGLQLAANDSLRGALTPAQTDRIKDAIETLVSELAGHDDTDASDAPTVHGAAPPIGARTPAWQSTHPVLCVAGRGPLDEAASAMLAQLLSKHGLGTRLLAHDAVSRANVGQIDPDGVAMICISYLDLTGSPSHLRYLLRRLRQRLPEARLLVGLWPQGEAVLTDPDIARVLGADHYVTSLQEAVSACVEACWNADEPNTLPGAAISQSDEAEPARLAADGLGC